MLNKMYKNITTKNISNSEKNIEQKIRKKN